jgi:hypothetical protein
MEDRAGVAALLVASERLAGDLDPNASNEPGAVQGATPAVVFGRRPPG